MIKQETLDYISKLPGGNWSNDEKRKKLYELVERTAREFPEDKLISVELGVFAGCALFSMANAHKDLQKGFAVGVDTWDTVTPLEGSNSEANNKWWASLDMDSIFTTFKINAVSKPEWSGNVEFIKGRTDKAVESFQDNSITLLHQDGNHNIETITKELQLYAPKVKIGGYWVADDTDWKEAKDAYAQLPQYGFEIVEDHIKWQVWVKVREAKPFDANILNKRIDAPTFELIVEEKIEPKETPVAEFVSNQFERNKEAKPLQFDSHTIMPILLTLPDTPEWRKRTFDGLNHFHNELIFPHEVAGIHAKLFGVTGTQYCFVDQWSRFRANYAGKEIPVRMPEEMQEQWYIGDANVGGCLSHYMLYNIMAAMPYEHYLVLEDDCRFSEGWREQLAQALKYVPKDFDVLFVGSACAEDKQPVKVAGNVYHFPYRPDNPDWMPQTGYCYIVAKKALATFIATQRTACINVDVQLIYEAFPTLNIYAILPRLSHQGKTHLPK